MRLGKHRHVLGIWAMVASAWTSLSTIPARAADQTTIGVVAKLGGVPWTRAIQAGVEKHSKELDDDGFVVGPTSADPALQVRAIEDLIARGVKVIGVLPNDADALDPVLKRAMDAGIIVLTNESPKQKNKNWDFELASIQGFGEAYAKRLAELMGGKGDYVVYVGSLTVPLHNAWADAAIAYLKKNYPDMHQISNRFGVAESVDDSRKTTLDLLDAHPNLKGILAFGSQGPIGAARAVQERHLAGKIIVLGTFSPGQGRKLLDQGVLSGGFIWNPEVVGEVFVTLGDMLAKKQPITDGMTIPGLGVVHPDMQNHVIIVNHLVYIDKASVGELAKSGL